MTETTSVHVLERLMQERRLTQEQLGLLLGVTRQRVHQMLSGTKPSDALLLRVARELHITIRDLVDDNGKWKRYDA